MLSRRVETQKIFTVEDCDNNPNKIYIFGDNLIGKGCAGQAIIRYCSNSYGIPTKRFPTNSLDTFFKDRPDEFAAVVTSLGNLYHLYVSKNKTLVFPEDGLSTGLAKLKIKSPEIYKRISQHIKGMYNLDIMS